MKRPQIISTKTDEPRSPAATTELFHAMLILAVQSKMFSNLLPLSSTQRRGFEGLCFLVFCSITNTSCNGFFLLLFSRRNNILLIHFLTGSLQKLTTSLIFSFLHLGRSLQNWQHKCFLIAQGSFCKAERYDRETMNASTPTYNQCLQ